MENNYYPGEQINTGGSYENQNQASTGMSADHNQVRFEHDSGLPIMFGIGIILFVLLVAILVYAYIAIAFQRMARKINIPDDWFAWIPVLNLVLVLRIANRPIWWIVLLFIPVVQVIVSVIIFMDVARAMGKEDWWGILMIFPGINLFVIGYLAFSNDVIMPQEVDSVQEDSIPKGAILADTKNTDFTEGLGMKNDAAGQWKTQSLSSDVSGTQSNKKDVLGKQPKTKEASKAKSAITDISKQEENLKKKDQK